MSVKSKYSVESIPKYETYDWLLHKHYAKRIPSISYSFGLFDIDKILIGICTFGSPPSHSLCIGICGDEFYKNVMEQHILLQNMTFVCIYLRFKQCNMFEHDLKKIGSAVSEHNGNANV